MNSADPGKGALNMFAGRIATLLLSLVALVLLPNLLGKSAHGSYQYYASLQLFLLGFLNGCASPIAAHYVALYRVSDPPRQATLLRQVFRWYVLLLLLLWLIYPLLREKTGFAWIYLSVAFSGASQLLASAFYGTGRVGPVTWFPVLSLALRIGLIGGAAWWFSSRFGPESMREFGAFQIPILLVLVTLPSFFWMAAAFTLHRGDWFLSRQGEKKNKASIFPWTEVRRLGAAALIGQVIFQVFTRSLAFLAGQMGYPDHQVGYIGLASQIFGQVVFLAGVFSVSLYPWLVSAGEAREDERFARLQAEAWRFSAVLGGWMLASILVLIRPAILVFLKEEYQEDIETLVPLIRIGAVAGALMLAGEFHLRILVSLTRMQTYLFCLALGFSTVVPYLLWVGASGGGVVLFFYSLPLGTLSMTALALTMTPRTSGFYPNNARALVACALSALVAIPFKGGSVPSLVIQGAALTLVYFIVAWGLGLIRKEDVSRVLRLGGADPEQPPV